MKMGFGEGGGEVSWAEEGVVVQSEVGEAGCRLSEEE